MAHIDITGTQHYVGGIGHTKTDVDPAAPVYATTNPVTGGIANKTYVLTQAQYDAIVTKDASTLYIIVG